MQREPGAAEPEQRDHLLRAVLLLSRRQAILSGPEDPQCWTFHQKALNGSRLWEERGLTGLGAVLFHLVFRKLLATLLGYERSAPPAIPHLDEHGLTGFRASPRFL